MTLPNNNKQITTQVQMKTNVNSISDVGQDLGHAAQRCLRLLACGPIQPKDSVNQSNRAPFGTFPKPKDDHLDLRLRTPNALNTKGSGGTALAAAALTSFMESNATRMECGVNLVAVWVRAVLRCSLWEKDQIHTSHRKHVPLFHRLFL